MPRSLTEAKLDLIRSSQSLLEHQPTFSNTEQLETQAVPTGPNLTMFGWSLGILEIGLIETALSVASPRYPLLAKRGFISLFPLKPYQKALNHTGLSTSCEISASSRHKKQS